MCSDNILLLLWVVIEKLVFESNVFLLIKTKPGFLNKSDMNGIGLFPCFLYLNRMP
jgi:hypothetical protein